MGIAKKQFAGMETNIPGIYSKSNYPPQGRGKGAASQNVVVLGQALCGVPYNASDLPDDYKLMQFASPTEALDMLRGGPAYYMSEFYLTPTKDARLNIPNYVDVCRVDPATHATSVLNMTGPVAVIDLISARYGLLANQLARKVVAGTGGGYHATILFQGKQIADTDNISLSYLSIQYTGSGSAAAMTINATTLTTTVTGATGDNLSITFSEVPTLAQLVAYINTQAHYTCTLLGKGDALAATLDAVTSQDIKTTAYIAKADCESLIQFFNYASGGEITAVLHTGATRSAIVLDTGFVYFASGSNGTVSNTDWAGALTFLEKMNVNFVLCASGDPAIQAMVDAHNQKMSQVLYKKNRSMGTGALASKTNDQMITEMKALGSARAEYCCTPFKRYDVVNGGVAADFDPFYGAALVAGIRFANGITACAEMQYVNVLSVTRKYTVADKMKLIDAGATLFEVSEDGIEVVTNLTTYQSANLILNIPSALRTCDHITLDSHVKIKERLRILVEAPEEMQLNEVYNYLITNLLPYYVEKKCLTKDPISGTPAFTEVKFDIKGDAFEFGFTGIVPLPLRFGFITQNFIVVGQYR
jgi:hypothetical protein